MVIQVIYTLHRRSCIDKSKPLHTVKRNKQELEMSTAYYNTIALFYHLHFSENYSIHTLMYTISLR